MAMSRGQTKFRSARLSQLFAVLTAIPVVLAGSPQLAHAETAAKDETRIVMDVFKSVCVDASKTAREAVDRAVSAGYGFEASDTGPGSPYGSGALANEFPPGLKSSALLSLAAIDAETAPNICQFTFFSRDVPALEAELVKLFSLRPLVPDGLSAFGRVSKGCAIIESRPMCVELMITAQGAEGSIDLMVRK
jgi:hypothetical protein